MTYFNCPHCAQQYDEYLILEQEYNLIELDENPGEKKFTLTCQNCRDQFTLTRVVKIQTTVRFYAHP